MGIREVKIAPRSPWHNPRKIPFTYAQAPGRHDAENWSRAVKQSMAHQYAVMMKQLGGELPDDASKKD